MRAVLEVDDRADRIALLLSDIVVARALSRTSVLPVTAQQLTKAMLRDLASRASALHEIELKLRAKGSDAAVALFLSEDAVGPSMMLSPPIQGTMIPMTDRDARRFCDRLVELGVALELTGRPTFRLYGIAP